MSTLAQGLGIFFSVTGTIMSEFLTQLVLPPIVQSQIDQNFLSPTVFDLQIGSQAIANLENSTIYKPVVQIITKENNKELFRMAGSADAQNAPLNQHDDSNIVNKANTAANVYEFFKIMNYINLRFWRGNQWKRGQDLLDGNLEEEWEVLIGGDEMIYETITTTQIQFDFSHLFELGYSMSEILHDIELLEQGIPIEVEVEITVPVGQTAHDGIIPETRQTIGSNFAGNGTLDTKVALNTNHLEMVNSPEMTDIFDEIWDGQTGGVNQFFESIQ